MAVKSETWEERAADLERKLQAEPTNLAEIRTSLQQDLVSLRVEATNDAVPLYVQRKRQHTLDRLSKLQIATDKPAATPKFAFNSRSNGYQVASAPANASTPAPVPLSANPATTNAKPKTTLKRLTLDNSASDTPTIQSSSADKPLSMATSFSHFENCILDLRGESLPALYLADITGSVILAPRVTGSVMLHMITGSLLLIGSHQLRMHTSKNSTVLLSPDNESTPIIEHCSSIRFGAIAGSGQVSVEDFSLNETKNWVKMDQHDSEVLYERLLGMPSGPISAEDIGRLLADFGLPMAMQKS